MGVAFPFVLMLLDVWPLRRGLRVLEKVPLLGMSAAASIVTLFAQRNTGAMMSLSWLPFSDRVANALVAYPGYLMKSFWPIDLAMLYPIHTPPAAMVLAASLVLLTVTAVAVTIFRERPYLMVGWLWFIGMLVPVIGLVQVGFQAMADRYMYVPMVGLSIAVTWALADAVASRPRLRRAAETAAILVLAMLTIAAYRQAQYWKDSITLFQHTISVTSGNYIVHNDLGLELQSAGRFDEATAQFRAAVAAAPEYKEALNNLGTILAYRGNRSEAIALHRRAVQIDPTYANARITLGHELLEAGETQAAFDELTQALRIEPESARGHAYLGAVLMNQGNFEDARKHLQYSVGLNPANAETQNNLCSVLRILDRPTEAIDACDAALRIRPGPGER